MVVNLTMGIKEKILASKIPPATIAKEIGMLRGTLHNKIKGHNRARFTIGEIAAIEAYLNKVSEDVKNA